MDIGRLDACNEPLLADAVKTDARARSAHFADAAHLLARRRCPPLWTKSPPHLQADAPGRFFQLKAPRARNLEASAAYLFLKGGDGMRKMRFLAERPCSV
jgi:hypothetical protein